MRRLAAAGVIALGVMLIVLLVAQLVLPGIASRRLRDQLAGDGQVIAVHVHAFPAIALLWHHADSVDISLGDYRLAAGQLGAKLGQTADAGSLTVSAARFQAGQLTLRNARLSKRGSALRASATVTEADLRAALPILESVTPVASGGGRFTLRGTASLLGLTAAVDVTVSPQRGDLVIAPDIPLGGLASTTIFSDPRISVQSVAAAPGPGGFSVDGSARLR